MILFNNLTMGEDASRLHRLISEGVLPPLTPLPGRESLRHVLERATFPTTKTRLLKRWGWRLIDLGEGRQARIGNFLAPCSKREFRGLEELLGVLEPELKRR